jgi:hypothetical protein
LNGRELGHGLCVDRMRSESEEEVVKGEMGRLDLRGVANNNRHRDIPCDSPYVLPHLDLILYHHLVVSREQQ